jgi:hypothetical protein
MTVIRISFKTKTPLVVSYRDCCITSWFWRPHSTIWHMKLIKSNFLLHWKGNLSPYVYSAHLSKEKYTVWEKWKFFFMFKEVAHSSHSDLRLKCNSVNIESDVALIFHYAALIYQKEVEKLRSSIQKPADAKTYHDNANRICSVWYCRRVTVIVGLQQNMSLS